jgi:hypothetical protein
MGFNPGATKSDFHTNARGKARQYGGAYTMAQMPQASGITGSTSFASFSNDSCQPK